MKSNISHQNPPKPNDLSSAPHIICEPHVSVISPEDTMQHDREVSYERVMKCSSEVCVVSSNVMQITQRYLTCPKKMHDDCVRVLLFLPRSLSQSLPPALPFFAHLQPSKQQKKAVIFKQRETSSLLHPRWLHVPQRTGSFHSAIRKSQSDCASMLVTQHTSTRQ